MKKWRNKPGPDIPVADGVEAVPDSGAGAEDQKSAGVQTESPGDPQTPEPIIQSAAVDEMPADVGAEPESVPLERLQRLQADFDNYRKRMSRERAEIVDRATEDLMLELLPVLDHFDIALRHAAEQTVDTAMVEGFRLVAEQLETALKKFGLQAVVAEGIPFDPHEHEAVAHLPDPDNPEGMITAQTRRGFRLGKKLLRASQVVVSRGAPSDAESETLQEEEA